MVIAELLAMIGANIDKSSFNQAEQALNKLKGTVAKVLGVIGVGLSLKSLNSLAEEYQAIRDKIGDMTKSHEEARKAQESILDTSKKLHKSFAQITGEVQTLIKNGKAADVEDALKKINEEAEKGGTVSVKIGDYIQGMRDEFGLWVADLWNSTEVAKKVGNMMERVFRRIMANLNRLRPYLERAINFTLKGADKIVGWVEKGIDFLGRIVDILGGGENVLRLIGVAIGIIIGFELYKRISAIMKLISPLTIGFLLLVLLVEDFIGFLQGKESLIGHIFEFFGISADDARENFFKFAEDFKGKLDEIIGFVQEHKETILSAIMVIGIAIVTVMALLNPIPFAIAAIAGAVVLIIGYWDQFKEALVRAKDAIVEMGENFVKWLEEIFGWLQPVADTFNKLFDAIEQSPLAQAAGGLWDKLFGGKQEASNSFEQLEFGTVIADQKPEVTAGADDAFSGIAESFQKQTATLPDDIQAMLDEMSGTVSDSKSDMEAAASTSTEGMVSIYDALAADSEIWGKDMMINFANGITNNMDIPLSALNSFNEQVRASNGFSLPEEGPLSEADEWMPDMMKLFGEGIRNNSGVVLETITALADGMYHMMEIGKQKLVAAMGGAVDEAGLMLNGIDSLVNGGIASLASLNAAVSSTNNNVSQKVNITNHFTGERAAQLQGARAMDKSAKDATGYMADALKFGR